MIRSNYINKLLHYFRYLIVFYNYHIFYNMYNYQTSLNIALSLSISINSISKAKKRANYAKYFKLLSKLKKNLYILNFSYLKSNILFIGIVVLVAISQEFLLYIFLRYKQNP